MTMMALTPRAGSAPAAAVLASELLASTRAELPALADLPDRPDRPALSACATVDHERQPREYRARAEGIAV
jgi:hypothetical protein